MSEISGDVSTIVTRLGADLSRETAKMTNEAMKQMLLYLIQKAKEQSDKAGEIALKKLVQSNDEIKVFDLEQRQLKAFSELAKKYEVSYAVVKDQNQLSVFYKQGEESRIKLVLEKLLERELNEKKIPITKIDNHEQQQSGLSLIREKLFAARNDKAETVESKNQVQEEVKRLGGKQNAVRPYEVTDPNGKIEMTLIIERNGVFERLEKHQLDERVKKILENMPDNQKHHFDVGNKGDRISVERQGNVFIFRAEQPEHHKDDRAREGNERTTLAQRLGHTKNEDRAVRGDQGERLSLIERREEIKPLMEAQKQAPPAKNKNRERGGR